MDRGLRSGVKAGSRGAGGLRLRGLEVRSFEGSMRARCLWTFLQVKGELM